MKYLFVLLTVLLVGCEASHSTNTNYTSLPPDLVDCKIYYLKGSFGENMTAMRCPNSTVSTVRNNKARTKSVVIDGVEYEQK